MTTEVGALPRAIVVELLDQCATVQTTAEVTGGVGAHGQHRRVGIGAGFPSCRPRGGPSQQGLVVIHHGQARGRVAGEASRDPDA